MNIAEFHDEYDNLSDERKKAGLKRLFDEVLREARAAEANDYFGTEGLDV